VARRQPVDIAGAFMHVNTRGNNRARLYFDGIDYAAWLRILSRAVERFEWRCHAYCLMPNHFHLLLELTEATLAAGMRHLNGSYAQRINTRYDRTGHVFEGPYSADLVESDEHFLAASRYIVLNPVRAGLCVDPADWPWSSFRATAGLEHRPPYLVVDFTRAMFGNDSRAGAAAYHEFVAAGAMAHDLVVRQ